MSTTSVRFAAVAVLVLIVTAPIFAGVRVPIEVTGDGVSNTITLDHPFLNANPDALVVVSQFGWEVTSAVQVYYSALWRITNNSAAPIPTGAKFWVMAFDGDSGFRHFTTSDNTTGHLTTLDDPRLNGNPDARPIVTPETTAGPAVPWPIGVWYNTGAERWTIFFQNTAKTMPIGASFSVFIPSADDLSLIHTADAGNTTGNYTVLNHPEIDHLAPLWIFATQRWLGTYNDANIGASWLFSHIIGNTNGASMPNNSGFNVFIFDPTVFSDGFESGNTSGWSVTAP